MYEFKYDRKEKKSETYIQQCHYQHAEVDWKHFFFHNPHRSRLLTRKRNVQTMQDQPQNQLLYIVLTQRRMMGLLWDVR